MVVTKVVISASNGSRADIVVVGDGGSTAHDSDIVVKGPAVVARVDDETLEVMDDTAAVCPGRADTDAPSASCITAKFTNIFEINFL